MFKTDRKWLQKMHAISRDNLSSDVLHRHEMKNGYSILLCSKMYSV